MEELSFDALIIKVRLWAAGKSLIKKENIQAQLCKVMEELGELASAVLKKDEKGVIDGIGDTFVTLIILSLQNGLNPAECLQAAYEEIKDRKGETVDGVFIKNSAL